MTNRQRPNYAVLFVAHIAFFARYEDAVLLARDADGVVVDM